MIAPVPSAIRCQCCRKKIRIRNGGAYFTHYLMVGALFTTLLILAHLRNLIPDAAIVIVWALAVVILEFVISLSIIRHATIEKPDANKSR